MLREGKEVVESGIEQLLHPLGIDAKVAMDQHIAKAGDAAEPAGERVGKNAELTQRVDGKNVPSTPRSSESTIESSCAVGSGAGRP